MYALAFDGPRRVRVNDVPRPSLFDPRDVLVRVTTAGLGPIELKRYSGPDPWPGVTPGSGGVGVVEAIGRGVRRWRLDDVVLVPPALHGALRPTIPFASPLTGEDRGEGERLHLGCDLHGTHAGWVRVPHADLNLVRVPDPANFEAQAAMVAATYAYAAGAASAVSAAGGRSVVLLGCDSMGLSFLAALRARNLSIGPTLAIDSVPGRLLIARRYGAATAPLKPGVDPAEVLRSKLDGKPPDVVVVSHGALADGDPTRLVNRGARLLLLDPPDIGHGHDRVRSHDPHQLVVGWPSVFNISACLEEVSTGQVDLLPLISHVFPMAEAPTAYEWASSPERAVLQVLLKP